jgi:hypothetical protein
LVENTPILAGAQIDLTGQPLMRKAQYQPFPAVSRRLRPYPTACAEGTAAFLEVLRPDYGTGRISKFLGAARLRHCANDALSSPAAFVVEIAENLLTAAAEPRQFA